MIKNLVKILRKGLIKYFKKPFSIIGLVGLIILSVYSMCVRNQRDSYSVGEIISYSRCAVSSVCVQYTFSVGNKIIVGKGGKGSLAGCAKSGWCIGKKFVVKYSSKNPENSIILLNEPVEEDSLKKD